jgi:hypothetical protein
MMSRLGKKIRNLQISESFAAFFAASKLKGGVSMCNEPTKKNCAWQNISKKDELIQKVKAGHFKYFQDLFAEVTSPYSDFFGIDPYPVWKAAHEHGINC